MDFDKVAVTRVSSSPEKMVIGGIVVFTHLVKQEQLAVRNSTSGGFFFFFSL